MASKLKDWLFPVNKKNEYTTTSLEVAASEIKEEDNSVSKVQAQIPPKIVKLNDYNAVMIVADDLLEGKSVIVDLSESDIDVARRIIDFLNGVIYSLDGKVEKVAKLVYLFAPTK